MRRLKGAKGSGNSGALMPTVQPFFGSSLMRTLIKRVATISSGAVTVVITLEKKLCRSL
ncbi:hypothetical protein D3C85_1522490 [compost metagenome]